MTSDIAIAQSAKMLRISQVAQRYDIEEEYLEPYGHYKAKISLDFLDTLKDKPDGKLIMVTAINPTPAGEGKTTTTIGLGDALNRIGKKAIICLREPSMGPVFGMKGGAAGGGYSQVIPMEDINLHFTGDISAVAMANNLLSALIDNHIHHGNELGIDARRVVWKRVIDMNDRSLRNITIGLGGPANGYPRADGFNIAVASEVMAIFCLATSLQDLKERLGKIVVAYTRDLKPILASDLKAHGAMAALLKDAIKPNMVQTLENNLAFIHGGPFANIATGSNSVIATKSALKLADYVVTESGFGADLDRVAALKPELAGFVTTNVPTITGDGIDMAVAVGAATVDMDQIQIHPSVYTETTTALITEGIRGDGAILVNQEGKRFVNELETRDNVSAAELAQEGGYAYTILDQKMMDASSTYNSYFTKGYAVQADSYEELAEKLGVDPATFAATMETWNKAVADQKDDEFGRLSFASALDTAPYYAIKVSPGIHHTMGGVKINTNAEVLTEAGEAIPGLYAAGEVTGGVHGANRLGGNAVADIVVFGRIAAQNAAAYIAK